MKKEALFTCSYSRMAEDARISSSHISLYLALFTKWQAMREKKPLKIKRAEIMRLAKINSRQTYNKRIKELHEYQYLVYCPSNDPKINSVVVME